MSLDTEDYGRIEKISFDLYNEGTTLQEAVERFWKGNGHYPKRILADHIYRTRENSVSCKKHGIRLSGHRLARPAIIVPMADEKQEYQDNTYRIELERAFSLNKRCYVMGLIMTKLEEPQLASSALSVFVTNLFEIQKRYVLLFYACITFETYIALYLVL